MNQLILVNDDTAWSPLHQHVQFTAQYSGAIIKCALTLEYLRNKGFSGELQSEAIDAFCSMISFDIEEDTQQAIVDEQFEDNGCLLLR